MRINLFDTVTYLRDRRIPYWEDGPNCQEDWVNIRCVLPTCTDTSNHLGINLTSGIFHCWKCGSRGSVSKIVQIIDKLKSPTMAESLMEDFVVRYGLSSLDQDKDAPKDGATCSLPKNIKSFDSMPMSLKSFILQRGISEATLRKHSSGWTDNRGDYKYRIIFPLTENGILKSFIGPLIFTFFIVLIILLLQFLWMYIDELAGKGLDFKILSELLYHFALTFVPTALPLGILLASLMTFGNMGEFSELSALKSSGIPLLRIMRPLIILIGVISVISFFFSNNVLPRSTDQIAPAPRVV